MDNEPLVVEYTIKELFGQINNKLDVMAIGLNSKADHADLEHAKARLDILEREGPPIAQEARRKVEELAEKVTRLQSSMATQEAIEEVTKNIKSNRTTITFTIIALFLQFAGLISVFLFKR